MMREADVTQKTYGSNLGLKINGKTHSLQTQNNEKYFLSRKKPKIQLGWPAAPAPPRVPVLAVGEGTGPRGPAGPPWAPPGQGPAGRGGGRCLATGHSGRDGWGRGLGAERRQEGAVERDRVGPGAGMGGGTPGVPPTHSPTHRGLRPRRRDTDHPSPSASPHQGRRVATRPTHR